MVTPVHLANGFFSTSCMPDIFRFLGMTHKIEKNTVLLKLAFKEKVRW